MKKLIIVLITMLLFLNTTVLAEDIDNWKYLKEIQSKEEGYKAVYLDEHIYRYTKGDLSDIRIIDNNGEFVPFYLYNKYLVTSNIKNREYKSKEILSFTKNKDSYYDFEIIMIDENTDIIGNKLLIDINKDDFFNEVEVFGSYDNEKWDFIKLDKIYRVKEAEKLDVVFDDSFKYRYYRIVFKNDTSSDYIKSFKLIMDEKEIEYEEYRKTKKIEYEILSNNKETIININNEDRLKINNIAILSNDDYKRNYILYFKNDEDGSFNDIKYGEIYRINLEKFSAENNNITLDNVYEKFIKFDTIRIKIINNDDKPINIEDIKINYFVDKIVFKGDKNNTYQILFGNKDTKKPTYDIESYKHEIEKEIQKVCSLSNLLKNAAFKENSNDNEQGDINYKLILDITIALISVILVILIIRKIKK